MGKGDDRAGLGREEEGEAALRKERKENKSVGKFGWPFAI